MELVSYLDSLPVIAFVVESFGGLVSYLVR